jgi:cytochrome c-type biogenesis protein CcmH/NrfF
MRRAPVKQLAVAIASAALLVFPPAAWATQPTLAGIEDQVMCTVCGVPLSMAREAPAAKRERVLIRSLIAQGLSEQQIKDQLVSTYGREVLVEPGGAGFDIWAWLVPIALTLGSVALLAWLLFSWRRAAADEPAGSSQDRLSDDDSRLVDAALREAD